MLPARPNRTICARVLARPGLLNQTCSRSSNKRAKCGTASFPRYAVHSKPKLKNSTFFDQTIFRPYSVQSTEDSDILVKTENKIMTVTLNRPKRYNAFTKQMFDRIVAIYTDATENESVSVVVLTGTGKYYSSGNDLLNFSSITPANRKEKAEEAVEVLQRYVAAHIDFPKPLIAAVNGHTIGLPFTSLGLFDAVYSSDEATFQAPFSKTGQAPEGCSSYVFPKIMGHSQASRLLVFDDILTATEAEKLHLVTKVFPSSSFHKDVQKEVEKISKLPLKTLVHSKKMLRDWERDALHKVNKEEAERLFYQLLSDDFINFMSAFMKNI